MNTDTDSILRENTLFLFLHDSSRTFTPYPLKDYFTSKAQGRKDIERVTGRMSLGIQLGIKTEQSCNWNKENINQGSQREGQKCILCLYVCVCVSVCECVMRPLSSSASTSISKPSGLN